MINLLVYIKTIFLCSIFLFSIFLFSCSSKDNVELEVHNENDKTDTTGLQLIVKNTDKNNTNIYFNIEDSLYHIFLSEGMEFKTEKLSINMFPFNELKRISEKFETEQAIKCLKITALDSNNDRLVFWIHQFKNNSSSEKFILDLHQICEKVGMESTIFRKNFSGFKKYDSYVLLSKRYFYNPDKESKYYRLIDIAHGNNKCW